MCERHSVERRLYLPVFALLHDELTLAKSLYASGDIDQAHSHLDKSRILRSKISRQQRQIREFSLEEWGSQLNLTESAITQYLPIAQACNQLWNDISKWLNTVIGQLNHDDLLQSDTGLNLLLDQQIPPSWDFHHDIVVLSGLNAELFVAPLVERGQAQIIVIVGADSNTDAEIIKPAAHATVLYIQHGDPLSDDQAAALKKVEPPLLHGISSGMDEQPLAELKRLARLVHKDHVVGASARRWPTIWTEQFIDNLPLIIGKKSVSEISSEFTGKDLLIVSPGPSLRDSLADLKRLREHFVLVSLVRSLPVLFDYGLCPDFAIMIDAQDHSEAGLNLIPHHSMLSEVPLIVSEYTHSSTFDEKFKEFLLLPAAQLIGSPLSLAIHGGSPPVANGSGVATFAISLAANLGARSITIVGQDLSIANGSYAAEEQDIAYGDDEGYLTCKGIDGSKLRTKADYLLFISELEALATAYSSEIAMLNCTRSGAYLDGWRHIPLDGHHPAVSGDLVRRAVTNESIGHANHERLGSEICEIAVKEAISEECARLKTVNDLASAIVEELNTLIATNSKDVNQLENLEQQLLPEMTTKGSLIAFYSCPAKLAAEASLQSVESLTENFMVSSDYYGSVAASANRLIERLSTIFSLRE